MPNLLLQNPNDVGYDIILAIGQSNMSGYSGGLDAARHDVSDPRVFQYGAAGTYANQISYAVDPLAHPDSPSGLGPALHFARWYALSVPTNRRVLIVPAARGGTPFEGNSVPSGYAWKVGRTDVTNLYENAIALTQAALAAANANFSAPTSRIVAAICIQGESDGDNGTSSTTYKTDLDALIAGLRSRLNVPNLPFILGGMVPDYCASGNRNVIHLAHVDTPNRNTRTAFAWGAWNNVNNDGNHYNAAGQRIMGKRLFAAYQRAINGLPQDTVPAPAPLSIIAAPGNGQVVINANGGGGYGSTYALYRGTTATGTPIATSFPFTDTGRTNGTAVSYVATATTAGGTVTSSVVSATPQANTTVTDSFNRADSSTSLGVADSGQTWNPAIGTWGISGNAAYSVTGANNDIALVPVGKSDQTVTAVVNGINGGTNIGLMVRATDAANAYMANFQGAQVLLFVFQNGGYSQLGTYSQTLTAGDTIGISAIGSTITVTKNGTTLGSVTNTAITTGTLAGLRIGGGTAAGRYDSFSAVGQ